MTTTATITRTDSTAPLLDGIHHVKLPVRDVERSRAWYESRLGFELQIEFVEEGRLMGVAMAHPNGGPGLALRLDPELAERAAGFDYFSIGVPTEKAIRALDEHLKALGETTFGVHFATVGWILPGTMDPDGHEVRFYTSVHHTATDGAPIRVEGSVQDAAAAREQEYLASR